MSLRLAEPDTLNIIGVVVYVEVVARRVRVRCGVPDGSGVNIANPIITIAHTEYANIPKVIVNSSERITHNRA